MSSLCSRGAVVDVTCRTVSTGDGPVEACWPPKISVSDRPYVLTRRVVLPEGLSKRAGRPPRGFVRPVARPFTRIAVSDYAVHLAIRSPYDDVSKPDC